MLYAHHKKIRIMILSAVMLGVMFSGIIAPIGEYTVHAQEGGQSAVEIFTDSTLGNVFKFFSWVFFKLSGTLLYLGGLLLDESIKYSLDTENFAKGAVEKGWTVLRDVANITFIFILLYIAIGTILRLGTINTKQALVNVIIIAFLINFSLFFTQVIVDASNILAAFFYNNIVSFTVDGKEAGVGTIITASLSPQTLLDPGAYEKLTPTKAGVAYIFSSIAVLLAAFSFFAVAIMFLFRTAVLILLMLLSPLAFAAYILENFREHFVKWWKALLNQAFFAPAYLLMIYIVLLVIHSGKLSTADKGSYAAAINHATGAFDESTAGAINPLTGGGEPLSYFALILTFFIIIFLINGALVVAKRLGGTTATAGTKWAGKGLGAAMGLGATGARRTVGQLFHKISKNKALKDAAASEEAGIGRFAARATLRGARFGARSSMDLRGKGTGALLGPAAGALGTDFGSVGRAAGGYEALRQKQVKKKVELAKFLGETEPGKEEMKLDRAYVEAQSKLAGVTEQLVRDMSRDANLQKEIDGLREQIKDIASGKEIAPPGTLDKLKTELASKDRGVSAAQTELDKIRIEGAAAEGARKAAGEKRVASFAEGEARVASSKLAGVAAMFGIGAAREVRNAANKQILNDLRKTKEEQQRERMITLLERISEKEDKK